MINGIISVLVVFVLLGVGFYFTYTKKWPDNTNQVFSTTVVQIAAPSLAVISIAHRFTPDLLKSSFWNLLLIAATILIMHLLAQLLGKLFKLEPKKRPSSSRPLPLTTPCLSDCPSTKSFSVMTAFPTYSPFIWSPSPCFGAWASTPCPKHRIWSTVNSPLRRYSAPVWLVSSSVVSWLDFKSPCPQS